MCKCYIPMKEHNGCVNTNILLFFIVMKRLNGCKWKRDRKTKTDGQLLWLTPSWRHIQNLTSSLTGGLMQNHFSVGSHHSHTGSVPDSVSCLLTGFFSNLMEPFYSRQITSHYMTFSTPTHFSFRLLIHRIYFCCPLFYTGAYPVY